MKEEFPQVPDAILSRVPGITNYDAEQLPLNRKMRRRAKRAEKAMLHLSKFHDEKTYVVYITVTWSTTT